MQWLLMVWSRGYGVGQWKLNPRMPTFVHVAADTILQQNDVNAHDTGHEQLTGVYEPFRASYSVNA